MHAGETLLLPGKPGNTAVAGDELQSLLKYTLWNSRATDIHNEQEQLKDTAVLSWFFKQY